MAKKISYKLVIGNSLISTQREQITKSEVYQYWKIVDELLPSDYYTYGNNNSFEDFCEEYSFLVKRNGDVMIINSNINNLNRYFRIGIPVEILNVFNNAGIKLNCSAKTTKDNDNKKIKSLVK